MWNHFEKGFGLIDDWLISGLEKGCHKFQRLTGRTNYWIIGKLSFGISACIFCAFMAKIAKYDSWWITALGVPLVNKPMIFVYGIILGGRFYNGTRGWQWDELRAFIRLTYQHANPQKISLYSKLFRYIALGIIPMTRPWFALWYILAVITWYLEACDPLPPCQGKVQEWLKKLSVKLRPVEVGV